MTKIVSPQHEHFSKKKNSCFCICPNLQIFLYSINFGNTFYNCAFSFFCFFIASFPVIWFHLLGSLCTSQILTSGEISNICNSFFFFEEISNILINPPLNSISIEKIKQRGKLTSSSWDYLQQFFFFFKRTNTFFMKYNIY